MPDRINDPYPHGCLQRWNMMTLTSIETTQRQRLHTVMRNMSGAMAGLAD